MHNTYMKHVKILNLTTSRLNVQREKFSKLSGGNNDRSLLDILLLTQAPTIIVVWFDVMALLFLFFVMLVALHGD